MASFISPVNTLVSMGGKFQEAKGYIERLDDVLRNEKDDLAKIIYEEKEIDRRVKLEGYVELNNITFGYSKLAEPLIKDFSLRLRPGNRVALVGESGSGKSTIAKLVSGLYEPWQGEIYFDGKKRSDISREIINNSVSICVNLRLNSYYFLTVAITSSTMPYIFASSPDIKKSLSVSICIFSIG